MQAVRHFLSWANRFMDVNYGRKRLLDVNSKNLEDKTAWDMLQEGNREIRVMLLCAGAKPGSSLSTFNRYPFLSTKGWQVLLLLGLKILDVK